MAVTLSKLAAGEERTASVELLTGESFEVRYNANAITGDLVQRADEEKSVRMLATILAEVLTGWDVLESDDGPALPITHEVLMGMPVAVLAKIFTSITEAQQPGEAAGSFASG